MPNLELNRSLFEGLISHKTHRNMKTWMPITLLPRCMRCMTEHCRQSCKGKMMTIGGQATSIQLLLLSKAKQLVYNYYYCRQQEQDERSVCEDADSDQSSTQNEQSLTGHNLMIVKCVRPMIVLFDLFIPYPGHKRLVIVAHHCVKAKLSKNEVSNLQLIVVSLNTVATWNIKTLEMENMIVARQCWILWTKTILDEFNERNDVEHQDDWGHHTG